MSYTPTEWVDGDVISADGLNKIETGIGGVNVSYTPTEWNTGDVITAEKLNNIEDGIVEVDKDYAVDMYEVPIIRGDSESKKITIDGGYTRTSSGKTFHNQLMVSAGSTAYLYLPISNNGGVHFTVRTPTETGLSQFRTIKFYYSTDSGETWSEFTPPTVYKYSNNNVKSTAYIFAYTQNGVKLFENGNQVKLVLGLEEQPN